MNNETKDTELMEEKSSITETADNKPSPDKKEMDEKAFSSKKKEEKKSEKKKNSFGKIITAIILIILLILGGLFVWNKLNENPDGELFEQSVNAELGQLEGKSEAEIEEELNRVIADGSMAISIDMHPMFPNGTAEGYLRIENSPANKYAQEVTIVRNDTKEVIYRSGLLMPNYHIDADKLLVDLPAGDYDCTATFTGYDNSNQEQIVEVGAVGANITISVLS